MTAILISLREATWPPRLAESELILRGAQEEHPAEFFCPDFGADHLMMGVSLLHESYDQGGSRSL